MQDKKQMENQDARQKKGEMRHKTKQNWETRRETKKWRGEMRDKKKWGDKTRNKKNGEMRRKTKKNWETGHETKKKGR